MMTPEDIAVFAMMLNLDVEAGRAKLADRIRTEQAAAVAAERERCAMIAETTPLSFYDTKTQREIAAAIRAVK